MWIMRQAGRYLPEYRELRTRVPSFLDFCFTPDLAVEATLQPIRRYGFDAAILFSDILVINWSLGQPVTFVQGEGPKLEPIRSASDLAALRPDAVVERLEPVFETIRRLKVELGPETPLIGFAGAPWTLATYMIEGGGSKDHAHSRRILAGDPALYDAITEMLENAVVAFLTAQIDAGVDAVKLFDSWAGALDPIGRERASLHPLKRIAARLKAARPETPIIAFPRNVGAAYAHYDRELSVDALALDASADLDWASGALTTVSALQGALDPIYLTIEDNAALDRAIERQRAAFRGRPHIFNLGHGVTPEASPEAVAHLVARWRGSVGV